MGGDGAARGAVHRLGNAALAADGHRFARALDEADVPVRGSVAVLTANVPAFLAAHRGATWSGRRFTPLSWRWTPDEVDYVVGNCEADALVVDARYAGLVAGAAQRVPAATRFATEGAIAGFRPWSEVEAMPGDPRPNPLAGNTMLYTSGTTGRPKGVLRTPVDGPPPSTMGRGGMEMLRACLGDGDPGTHLVCTPLHHAGPLTYAEGAALLGAELVLMERFEPEHFLALVEEQRVTSTFMVATQFVRLLRLPGEVRERYDVSTLQLLVHGSAPTAPEVKRSMIDWLGPVLFEFYGGTEGGGISIDSRAWLAHPGSVGRPLPGRTVEILDPEGRPVASGVEGEVWFRGGDTFEYKDDPEKTASAWNADRYTIGDIGYLDDEGYLYLCDRRADVIISGGVNVYPAQIEAVLLAHPGVRDCCVVGVPDDEWGEAVRAVVQPEGAAGPELEEELLARCREHLAGYQVPRAVDVVEALPRTETGKLARREVRNRYWAGRARRI